MQDSGIKMYKTYIICSLPEMTEQQVDNMVKIVNSFATEVGNMLGTTDDLFIGFDACDSEFKKE